MLSHTLQRNSCGHSISLVQTFLWEYFTETSFFYFALRAQIKEFLKLTSRVTLQKSIPNDICKHINTFKIVLRKIKTYLKSAVVIVLSTFAIQKVNSNYFFLFTEL